MKKAVKNILAVALIGSMALSMTSCSKIKPVSTKDFEKAIEEVFDCDDKDDEFFEYEGKDYEYVGYSDNNIYVVCYVYDDEDDAYDAFDDIYDEYEDMMDDKDFEGKSKAVFTDTYGYITLNGEADTKGWMDDEIYGGFYFSGDTFITVMTTSTSDKKVNLVKDFLNEIGYPKP
ncbi:MAG: hypothetical protein IKT14_06715 [Clostridiales bacterium]|nr:hypothetical protein [Clostridiales bacterium]MBR6484696.1 hypothetical protein [Clostridiales bacterium]